MLVDALFSNSSILYTHCKRYSSILSRILALAQGLVFFRIYIYLICRQYATYSLDCENLYLPGGQRVFLYYQDFQWSSTLFTFTRQCLKLQCFSHIPKRGEHLFFYSTSYLILSHVNLKRMIY